MVFSATANASRTFQAYAGRKWSSARQSPRELNPSQPEVEFSQTREFYMKKSKFPDSQIIGALKRVEAGLAVSELCRELGNSSATFYKWRARYGGMNTSMIERMW